MEFVPGASRFQDLISDEEFDENTGIETVVGAGTQLAQIAFTDVKVGDRILLWATMKCAKDITPGGVSARIQKTAGTAVGLFNGGVDSAEQVDSGINASATTIISVSAMFTVTTAGTITFDYTGFSGPGDATAQVGDCSIFGIIFRVG